jgi:glutaminyl-peptide cyclotransferase
MKKSYLAGILLGIVILAVGATAYILLKDGSSNDTTQLLYTYEVVKVYPHDTNAFTEGLVFENGTLYEGTGLYGESRLQKVELETGNVTQFHSLPASFFGEGITILDDKIVQLTWLEQVGFVYEKDSFRLLRNFSYPTEGWGITTDGEKLIMSDGTATLHFLDPKTFQETGTVEVHDSSGPVSQLNELEYVKGDVYANIFEQKRIAIINITTGQLKAWVDLHGLRDPSDFDPNNVLNGIAYDANGGRLFVTGKRWTQLFEIRLFPMK